MPMTAAISCICVPPFWIDYSIHYFGIEVNSQNTQKAMQNLCNLPLDKNTARGQFYHIHLKKSRGNFKKSFVKLYEK
jgi:hypothetical protein